jgi:hypothetical protein
MDFGDNDDVAFDSLDNLFRAGGGGGDCPSRSR